MKRKIIKTHELNGNYILEVQVDNKIHFETYVKLNSNHPFIKGLLFEYDKIKFNTKSKLGIYIYQTFIRKLGTYNYNNLVARAHVDGITGFENLKPRNLIKHYNIASYECLETKNIYFCYGDEFLYNNSTDIYMSINLSTEYFDYADVLIEIYELHTNLELYINESENIDISLIYSYDDFDNIFNQFKTGLNNNEISIKSDSFNNMISHDLDSYNYYVVTTDNNPCSKKIDIIKAKLYIEKYGYSNDGCMEYRIVLSVKNRCTNVNSYRATDYIYVPDIDVITIKDKFYNNKPKVYENYTEALIAKASKAKLNANEINNLKQILIPKCNLLNTMIEKDNQC